MERQAPKGRSRLGGNGRHARQYKLNAESVEKKLAVLASFAAACDIKTTIARFYPSLTDTPQYNTKRTQIYRWKKSETKLQAAARDHREGHKKVRAAGLGTILPLCVEEDIVHWVSMTRKEGMPISTVMLKENAKERAQEAGIDLFCASSPWIERFKSRHRMSMQPPTRQGQTRPEDTDTIANAFTAEVRDLVDQLSINRVYNADQTDIVGTMHFLMNFNHGVSDFCCCSIFIVEQRCFSNISQQKL